MTFIKFIMIMFTQSTAVVRKYLNGKLKYFVCYNFSEVAQDSLRIP